MEREEIIEAIVEHRPGVLFRVSNLIRRRNFNIETITVGRVNHETARMTMTIKGEREIIDQVINQLSKLMEVIKVRKLNQKNTVKRELALIKVKVNDNLSRSDIIHCIDVFRGQVVDVSSKSLIAEITGTPDKINAFIQLLSSYGIKEVARTGITAMERDRKLGGS